MDNQHRKISGYRELDQEQIALINEIKTNANGLGQVLDVLNASPEVDKRALAIARTELQTGFMWLIRSITRPDGF